MQDQRTIAEYVCMTAIIIGGFFGFLSVSRAIGLSDASNFIAPALWFSLWGVALCTFLLIARRRVVVLATLFGSFMMSFFFAFHLLHLITIIFAWGIATFGVASVKKDLALSLRIDAKKSLRTGLSVITIGLMIVITSQYYWSVKNKPIADLLPRVEESQFFKNIVDSVVQSTTQRFTQEYVPDNSLTQGLLDRLPSQLTPDVAENFLRDNPTLLPDVGSQVQELLGAPLENAQKNISETMPKLFYAQLQDSLLKNTFLGVFLPEFLALLIFVSTLSVSVFLKPLWLIVTHAIFIILKKQEVIAIKKVQKDAEMIV